ncbi:hypothetical protein TIFTF001_002679 [Ficus carica]|uniref:Uncharacterized protein n=1 Tax=Ficus carica TaxID=3494 RepID=A0AA87ZE73_FICCA|nr:hypothetical protein TIFTF001_002679 [Ficus carica]
MLGVREKERNGDENVERERRAINGRRIWAALGLELEFVLDSEKGLECNGVGKRRYYNLSNRSCVGGGHDGKLGKERVARGRFREFGDVTYQAQGRGGVAR